MIKHILEKIKICNNLLIYLPYSITSSSFGLEMIDYSLFTLLLHIKLYDTITCQQFILIFKSILYSFLYHIINYETNLYIYFHFINFMIFLFHFNQFIFRTSQTNFFSMFNLAFPIGIWMIDMEMVMSFHFFLDIFS